MSTKLKFDNYGSSVFGSRDRGLSSKPILKDSRPFLINSSKMQHCRREGLKFQIKRALRIPCTIC
jgi:hypothetical protein